MLLIKAINTGNQGILKKNTINFIKSVTNQKKESHYIKPATRILEYNQSKYRRINHAL